jgi:glutamate/tyrosine decarboxylase-like PLP-dependent enzyme
VRDGELLRQAHQLTGDYHKDLVTPDDEMNLTDYSLEQSRSFRGLRVWLPLKMFGTQAFREALSEKLHIANWLHNNLRQLPGFECPTSPDLSIVTFVYHPKRGDVEEFNRKLIQEINATRRLFLSGTILNGRYVIRICVLCFRTHQQDAINALDPIFRVARDLEG